MDKASEPGYSPIMARIAKVRKRMLIEVVTGVPASNKALFLPLCQDYEQQDEEKLLLSIASSRNSRYPYQISSIISIVQGSDQQRWHKMKPGRKVSDNLDNWDDEWDDDWDDWDKKKWTDWSDWDDTDWEKKR